MSDTYSHHEAELVYEARLRGLGDGEWTSLREALHRVEAAPSLGYWTDSVQQADGSWLVPYATLSAECHDFLRTLAGLGLYIPFDWPTWDHGRALAEAPQRLAQATPAQAAMLIFAIWRSDRFVEGALLDAFDSGLIQNAARRVLTAAKA